MGGRRRLAVACDVVERMEAVRTGDDWHSLRRPIPVDPTSQPAVHSTSSLLGLGVGALVSGLWLVRARGRRLLESAGGERSGELGMRPGCTKQKPPSSRKPHVCGQRAVTWKLQSRGQRAARSSVVFGSWGDRDKLLGSAWRGICAWVAGTGICFVAALQKDLGPGQYRRPLDLRQLVPDSQGTWVPAIWVKQLWMHVIKARPATDHMPSWSML
ncbi:hypothetical protein GGTG_13018 [Gaeumannomyces tritici R3-111a-1]|uniref:Uncharacterized protein n=1 Tax=Gaeumannomyces tritici (strain R3-111a-1) TaxID=644352 RepID=J3PHN8_GAET3|nr:hypothetical protein GGTG_13018 [Gaeumannomyces tritici R3-111a-1]EJT69399.1 hypothetical protein GGTG_13018 [Gaeumannomyces tritici R3-111a-1]